MASNIQRGTVKLDASDWTRLKRIGGTRGIETVISTNKDITNPQPTSTALVNTNSLAYPGFGTSRIRRPASNWIAYKAFNSSDYPTQSSLNNTVTVTINKLCECTTSLYTTQGICSLCSKV
jgi:hypothetical protein